MQVNPLHNQVNIASHIHMLLKGEHVEQPKCVSFGKKIAFPDLETNKCLGTDFIMVGVV